MNREGAGDSSHTDVLFWALSVSEHLVALSASRLSAPDKMKQEIKKIWSPRTDRHCAVAHTRTECVVQSMHIIDSSSADERLHVLSRRPITNRSMTAAFSMHWCLQLLREKTRKHTLLWLNACLYSSVVDPVVTAPWTPQWKRDTV